MEPLMISGIPAHLAVCEEFAGAGVFLRGPDCAKRNKVKNPPGNKDALADGLN
jgi:hypothetical protein